MQIRLWLSMLALPLAVGCASTGLRIPDSWQSVPATGRIGSVSYDAQGKLVPSRELQVPMLSDGPIRLVGTQIFNRDKQLTDPLPALESLDFSESRGEVVFSAIGARGYDIGLVSSDGSQINWVPQDPADEFSPHWAPRGNKASYVVRGRLGDVVRTVHIPTATQLSVPFIHATVHARAWDAEGQFFAVAYSTPDASDRVETMKYGGEERRMAIPPAAKLDVVMEPFAPGAVILRPNDLRYDEKVPLVVWEARDFSWSDARAALQRKARVAVLVTTTYDQSLWALAKETPWIDLSKAYAVFSGERRSVPEGVTVVQADPALPAGRYTQQGHVVLAAPPAIQSLAAGFIADQLKRISSPNGSSR
jgi:hypothetical protein